MSDATSSSTFETLLILGGLLFGLATVVVGVVARRKTDSQHRGSPYALLGFLFNFLSCTSLETLIFILSDTPDFSFLPLLLLIGLGWGLVGAASVFQSIWSYRWSHRLLKKRSEPSSSNEGGENGQTA